MLLCSSKVEFNKADSTYKKNVNTQMHECTPSPAPPTWHPPGANMVPICLCGFGGPPVACEPCVVAGRAWGTHDVVEMSLVG